MNDWKLSREERTAVFMGVVGGGGDGEDAEQAMCDAAARKALEWAAQRCEQMGVDGGCGIKTYADVIREGLK